jgi:signal transduction histidine kinase
MTGSRWLRLFSRSPMLALFGLAVLIGAGVYIARDIDAANQAARMSEITVQARTLAATVPGALAFGNRSAAQDYADAARANPQVLRAGVYASDGRLLAYWSRHGEAPPPAVFDATKGLPSRNRLIVTVPVRDQQMTLGDVFLESTAEPRGQRYERYGLIILIVGMTALVLMLLALGQRELGKANAELAERAVELSSANAALLEEIEQREKAEAALRQSQKMEAIGHLTGGIAHDFNNLLQVILGNLERLQRRALGEMAKPDTARLLESAARSGQRAAMLTQRLLAFSRCQPLAPQSVDPNQLVLGMADLISRSLGEKITLATALTAAPWRMLADANQLENTLLNLAVNARDAMPAGGRLSIETANVHLDPAFLEEQESEDAVPGDYVMIAVGDTGSGMSREVLAKVFEPFFTTKAPGQGTGLGLSQVYGFVRQSGGLVRIESEPGAGTVVRLYLPRMAKAGEPAETIVTPSQLPGARGNETVLLVEDQVDVRATARGILRDLGYRVVEAGSAGEALRILALRPDVNLLLSDIGLPGAIDGHELAEQARMRRPGLQVILMTGYAREPGTTTELVVKPFTGADLALRIRRVLDGTA